MNLFHDVFHSLILFLQQFWIYRRARRLYYQQFSLLLFILTSILLLAGLYYFETNLVLSSIISLVLLFAAFSYYLAYLKKYTKITDIYTDSEYYFNVFSLWGVISFSGLFLLCFAFLAIVIDEWSNNALFQSAEYEQVALHLVQAAINGVFFGTLDTLNLHLCQLQEAQCKFNPSWRSNFYTLGVTAIAEFAFLAALKGEIEGWREARRGVTDLLKRDGIEPESLRPEEIKKIQVILKDISAGKLDTIEHERKLVHELRISRQKPVRSVYLSIMQSTKDMQVFQDCLNYFVAIGATQNQRFKRVCRRIKYRKKQQLIKQLKSR